MRLIDADKLIRIYFNDDDGNKTFEFVPAEFIDSAPTIDAVPVRHGEWIKLDPPAFLKYHKCSVCDEESLVPTRMGEPLYNYCPHCGAKMNLKGVNDELV